MLKLPFMEGRFGEEILCMWRCTWHLMPARLHAQVSGSQKPRQSHPQVSLESRKAWSCLFSSLSMNLTPAACRMAWRCLEENGWRKPLSSWSLSLTSLSVSSSGIWSVVSLSASCWSMAPLVISWSEHNRSKSERCHADRRCKRLEMKCTYFVF